MIPSSLPGHADAAVIEAAYEAWSKDHDSVDPTWRARDIVLATDSAPVELPVLPFDGGTVVSSDHAIAFNTIPQ